MSEDQFHTMMQHLVTEEKERHKDGIKSMEKYVQAASRMGLGEAVQDLIREAYLDGVRHGMKVSG